MKPNDLQRKKQEADNLYEQYGKPLERQHQGEYVAISTQGKTVVAPTLPTILKEALPKLGPGSFIFKVGEKAVWKFR